MSNPEVSGWLCFAGAAADILTSAPHVENELNPIAAWVFSQVGFWAGAILMKFAAVLVAESIAYVRGYPEWFRVFILSGMGLAWLCVAFHNLNVFLS